MSDLVIEAAGLGKRYQLGKLRTPYATLREQLVELGKLPRKLFAARRPPAADVQTFWALRDVSFDVRRGEVVGIVGRNGAGKSTLLKILSRIVEPTEGQAIIVGRVGALLEVGTGFHPELTGRENIFLNGAILGMRRGEILAKFDEIVAFAEIDRFIDTPVKHYSSGMGLKLGFAVAAHLEPEILVVDEVLAVGDAAFQKKCLGKMGDVARQGRTVLFVSHNMAAVRSLCTRALLLEGGKIALTGRVEEVVDRYLHASIGAISEREWVDASAPGDGRVRLRAARIRNAQGRVVEQVNVAEPLSLEVEYEVSEADMVLNLVLFVHNQDGVCAFATTNVTDRDFYAKEHAVGRYRSSGVIPGNYLNEGRYSITVQLTERARRAVAIAEHAIAVDVVDLGENRGGYFGAWPGVVRPLLEWRTAPIESGVDAQDALASGASR